MLRTEFAKEDSWSAIILSCSYFFLILISYHHHVSWEMSGSKIDMPTFVLIPKIPF